MAVKVLSVGASLDNSGISFLDTATDKSETKRLLSEALVLLNKHAADRLHDCEHQLPQGAEPMNQLLHDLRAAFDSSVWGNRTHDDEGERRAFDILVEPSSHEVTFRSTAVDNVFHDQRSLAEHAGIMRCSNTFNLVMYVFYFTVGNLMLVTVIPMGLSVMAYLWSPGLETQRALLGMWLVFYCFDVLWKISYMLSYIHLGALAAIIQEQPEVLWLILSRFVYTISCAFFSPTVWNLPALVSTLFAVTYEVTNDASLVFFRLRQTRAAFDMYFTPKKGCRARLQIFLLALTVVWDIARHMAVLYSVQFELEFMANKGMEYKALGVDKDLASLSVAGNAFSLTLKDLVNASYTASMTFQLRATWNNLQGFGRKAAGSNRLVINTK